MMRIILTTVAFVAALMILVTHAEAQSGAATFDILSTQKFENWGATLYLNRDGNRHFCVAATKSKDGTTLRINEYLENKDAFLELFNPKWNLRKGQARFSLQI